MAKSKSGRAIRWEDLEYSQIGGNRTEPPALAVALKQAGVPVVAQIIEAERTEQIEETEVSWGSTHGVEFEAELPSPPRYRTLPAIYRYSVPEILRQLDLRWDDTHNALAAWAAKTFSPGTLGTMYALREGDWAAFVREQRRMMEKKGND